MNAHRYRIGCRLFLCTLAVLFGLSSGPAVLAHGPKRVEAAPDATGTVWPATWSELGRAWAWEPLIVGPLTLSAILYAVGLGRLWTAAGLGRGVRRWEAGCFVGGWLALAVALVSPLHPWGGVLFSAHMTQHEILMLVAAPLLVLGKPVVASLKALPSGWASKLVRWTGVTWWQATWHTLTNPFVAWLLHAVILWGWDLPALYQAAIDDEFIHALQHLSFLLSALLFWWAVIHGKQRAAGYGVAVLYMFTTALHSGFLGALITFAADIWYPSYRETTAAWGLTPLEDQQLGGLVMWVPACTVYIVAGLALFAGWLRSSEARVRRWEAGLPAPAETRPNEVPTP